MQAAARIPSGQIAGAVELASGKRRIDKAARRHLFTLPVALGDAIATDPQFTFNTNGLRLHVVIEDEDLRIRDGRANRRCHGVGIRDHMGGGPDRGFCRAVHVLDGARGAGLQGFDQRAGQRLTPDHEVIDLGKRHLRFLVRDQHLGHGGGALQVCDIVAYNLSGKREVIGVQRCGLVRQTAHFSQWLEAFHDQRRINTVVDQASNLGHADALELFGAGHAIGHGAEHAAVVEIALEGKFKDRIKLFIRQAFEVEIKGVCGAFGAFEGREGPSVLLDEGSGGAQVVLHWATGDGFGFLAGVGEVAVQHQGDGEVLGIVARVAQRLMVDLDLVGHFFDRLTQQVCQDIGTDLTRLFPGLRVARCGDPDGQLFGDRSRLGDNGVHGAVLFRELHRLTGPHLTQLVDDLIHRGLVRRWCVLRAQDEIVRLPAGGDGEADAAVGEVVDDRPFLGNPRGMVQRRDARACAYGEVLRNGRNCSAGDGGVRVRAAEGVEVTLGRPDGVEAVGIGEFRALQEQFVLFWADAIVIAPVHQVEVHLGVGDRDGAV